MVVIFTFQDQNECNEHLNKHRSFLTKVLKTEEKLCQPLKTTDTVS